MDMPLLRGGPICDTPAMDCDFLIIGGGVAGLSAGAALADLGRVCVIEAEEAVGYHASGRSAALFEENYGSPSTRALNRASRAWHEAEGVLSARGFMMVADAATEDAFAGDVEALQLDEIAVEEARRRVPILSDTVRRAAYSGAAQDIDTDLLLQGYVRRIRAAGGAVLTGQRVTGIAPGWEVTAGNVYRGRVLVNAAGAWADQVAALAGIAPLGLTPLRRSVARLTAPGGHDVSDWPMLFGPGESWYAKPDAGAWLVSPAEEDPSAPMDAWADDMVLAEGMARYQPYVTEEVTRPIATWAGLRTFAPDRSLVLGPEPSRPDFVWAAGQGGYGMQSSPAAGQLVADLIAGRAPELDRDVVPALSPARFR